MLNLMSLFEKKLSEKLSNWCSIFSSVQSINDMGLTTSLFIKKAKYVLQLTVDDLLEKGFYVHHNSMDLKGFMSLVNYLDSAEGAQEVRTLAAIAVFSHQRQLFRSSVKKVQDDYAVRKAELELLPFPRRLKVAFDEGLKLRRFTVPEIIGGDLLKAIYCRN